MARWKYDDTQPGTLVELDLALEAGQEFDAPDDWRPEPYPHPVYKSVADKKPAPAKAPQE